MAKALTVITITALRLAPGYDYSWGYGPSVTFNSRNLNSQGIYDVLAGHWSYIKVQGIYDVPAGHWLYIKIQGIYHMSFINPLVPGDFFLSNFFTKIGGDVHSMNRN